MFRFCSGRNSRVVYTDDTHHNMRVLTHFSWRHEAQRWLVERENVWDTEIWNAVAFCKTVIMFNWRCNCLVTRRYIIFSTKP